MIKLGAFAALFGACAVVVHAALTVVFNEELRNPANTGLEGTFQTAYTLTHALAWLPLAAVVAAMFGLDRTRSSASYGTVVLGGIGIAVVVFVDVVFVVSGTNLYFFSQVAYCGGLAVGAWLFLANRRIQRQAIFGNYLTQIGMAFGAFQVIVSLGLLFNVRSGPVLDAGFGTLVAAILWESLVGVALLRPLPVNGT